MTDDHRPAIRDAEAHDAAALLRIWRTAVEATHAFLTADDVDWYGGIVADALPRVPGLRVAVRDDRPVGFIAADDGVIHMLFVEPALHGRGIGTALLDDAALRHDELLVDVNEGNPSGRRFYESRGFTTVGRSEVDDQGRPFPILHLRRGRIRDVRGAATA